MILWMKVTKDKYELPVAVADSATELAKILHTSPGTIYSSIYHGNKSFVKVTVDGDYERRDESE